MLFCEFWTGIKGICRLFAGAETRAECTQVLGGTSRFFDEMGDEIQ